MKLTFKIVMIVLLGMAVLLVIESIYTVNREAEQFKADIERDTQVVGRILAEVVSAVYQTGGPKQIKLVIARLNRLKSPIGVSWVWLDPAEVGTERGPGVADLQSLRQGREVTKVLSDRVVSFIPVRLKQAVRGAIVVHEPLEVMNRHVRQSITSTVLLFVAMILLAIALLVPMGILLVGRPLSSLIEKTREIGRGERGAPLLLERRDELSELAVAINSMNDRINGAKLAMETEMEARISAIKQLRHADRLRTVGQLAAGIAHELGTPLNVVSGRASMIIGGSMSHEKAAETARIIKNQVERMTSTVRQLLDFARARTLKKSNVDLDEIIQQTIGLLEPQVRNKGAILVQTNKGAAPIQADGRLIQQALANLLMNALHVSNDGDEVKLGYGTREIVSPPNWVEVGRGSFAFLSVQDAGPGISPNDLPHVFDPFFTTKDVGEGTGLGLTVAFGIIRDHGGWIDVQSQPEKGSCFTMYIPLETV